VKRRRAWDDKLGAKLDKSIIIEIAVAVIAIAAFSYWYFAHIPKLAAEQGITDPTKVAKFRDSLTKGPAQLLGGVAVLLTFVWTIVSGAVTLRQTAVQSANQQFFNAAKLATNETGGSQAAGNYALEKLVLGNPDYCGTVTDILINEITKNTHTVKLDGSAPPHVGDNISAAIVVLGAMPLCNPDAPLRLIDEYMAGANFGASTYFQGADLRNSKLWGAYLGWANFDKAQFDGAGMADEEAIGGDEQEWKRVTGARDWQTKRFNFIVNFDHSRLRQATLMHTSVSGASFTNADLDGADFTDTNISGSDFSGAQNLDKIVWKNSEEKALAACYFDGQEPKGLGQTLPAVLRHPC
jgi:hypothetical protein